MCNRSSCYVQHSQKLTDLDSAQGTLGIMVKCQFKACACRLGTGWQRHVIFKTLSDLVSTYVQVYAQHTGALIAGQLHISLDFWTKINILQNSFL